MKDLNTIYEMGYRQCLREVESILSTVPYIGALGMYNTLATYIYLQKATKEVN